MITDTMTNCKKYFGMHDKFRSGFEFIEKAVKENLAPGKYEIDGDLIYANISEYDTREYTSYEAHKKYIDIQYIISGNEIIYYNPLSECRAAQDFNEEKDYGEYTADTHSALNLKAGMFAVFYPEDAHAPCLSPEKVSSIKKVVVKVKI